MGFLMNCFLLKDIFNFSDLSYHCYVLKDLSPNVAEFVLSCYIYPLLIYSVDFPLMIG